MTYAFACDHAGVSFKNHLIQVAQELGFQTEDLGTDSDASVDYPDYAQRVGEFVQANMAEHRGVLICGTGIGMSIAANKMKGIRAALVFNDFMAEMAHKHNNANVLCFAARVISENEGEQAFRAFVQSSFEGGRHERRVKKMMKLEEQ